METKRLDSKVRNAPSGTRALVAAGASPHDRPCVAGELVWVPPVCGRPGCACDEGFTGATTHGLTDIARVTVLAGAGWTEVQRSLADAMCHDCLPDARERWQRAGTLLEIAKGLPVGTTLRRDRGLMVPLHPIADRSVR